MQGAVLLEALVMAVGPALCSWLAPGICVMSVDVELMVDRHIWERLEGSIRRGTGVDNERTDGWMNMLQKRRTGRRRRIRLMTWKPVEIS